MQSSIIDFSEPNLLDCVIQSSVAESSSNAEQSVGDILKHFDPSHHAYIRLSILMKNNNLNEIPDEYIFTRDFGRVPSSATWHDESKIVVGRSSPKLSHPIDIDIRNNFGVNHLYCQILTSRGWETGRLTRQFVEFLKGASRPTNLWYRLPKDLYRTIWTYAAQKPAFFIQDLGSTFGTLIRLRSPKPLVENYVFTVGLYSMIKILKMQKKVPLDQYLQLSQKWSNVGLIELGAIKTPSSDLYFSYSLICVEDYRQKTRQNYVLTCSFSETATITIGRHLSNNIVIAHSQVSRKHCTLFCEKGEWAIVDGAGRGHCSSNGTWRDIRTIQEIDTNSISHPLELHHSDEIKIGDTYIRFEIFNNSK